MAASYNRVILLGNLTRDPEVRSLASGMTVADIGLAVNDRRKDANGTWIEEATFIDATVWGRNAEVLGEFARKGTSIFVEGRLKLDTWENDGQKRSKLKVVVERVCLVGSRSSGNDAGSNNYSGGGYRSNSAPARSQNSYSNQNSPYSGGNSGPTYEPAPEIPGDDIPF